MRGEGKGSGDEGGGGDLALPLLRGVACRKTSIISLAGCM